MPLLIATLLFAACAAAPSDTPTKADKLIVPSVKKYTPAQMNKAADELTMQCNQGKAPMTNMLVTDYGVMRDQSRAAQGLKVDLDR